MFLENEVSYFLIGRAKKLYVLKIIMVLCVQTVEAENRLGKMATWLNSKVKIL